MRVESHDGAPIPNTKIELQDAEGRAYTLSASSDGRYNQAMPPGTYTASASAYGYGGSSQPGIVISAGGATQSEFTLAALPPAATNATAVLDAGAVRFTWLHVSPNTGYQIHRSASPYFSPDALSEVVTIDANHPPATNETVTYRDGESGAGDVDANDFYMVYAMNAAGVGLPSNRLGEFDFALVK